MASTAVKLGIWLDHREAKLIDVTNAAQLGAEPSVSRIGSDVEDKVKDFGHRPNLAPQSDARSAGSAEEKHLDRRREQDIKSFFEEIAGEAAGAKRVLVLGPGQAPRELVSFLGDDRRFEGVIEGVESADANLTENEVVEKVRKALGEPPMRRQVAGPNN